MAFRSLSPFDVGRPAGLLDRFFDDWLRAYPPGAAREGVAFAPRMDVREDEKEIVLSAELPGVDEKDIQVALTEDVLTIKGEKKSERREEKKDDGYTLTERSFGAFQRTLRLPFTVGENAVSATFDKGVLTVTVRKPPAKAAAAKTIPIGKAG